jgi:hypothetical protein
MSVPPAPVFGADTKLLRATELEMNVGWFLVAKGKGTTQRKTPTEAGVLILKREAKAYRGRI